MMLATCFNAFTNNPSKEFDFLGIGVHWVNLFIQLSTTVPRLFLGWSTPIQPHWCICKVKNFCSNVHNFSLTLISFATLLPAHLICRDPFLLFIILNNLVSCTALASGCWPWYQLICEQINNSSSNISQYNQAWMIQNNWGEGGLLDVLIDLSFPLILLFPTLRVTLNRKRGQHGVYCETTSWWEPQWKTGTRKVTGKTTLVKIGKSNRRAEVTRSDEIENTYILVK